MRDSGRSSAGFPEDSKGRIHLQALINRMRLASTLAQGGFPGVGVGEIPRPSSWRAIVDQLTGIAPSIAEAAAASDPEELALALGSADLQLK